MIKIVIGVLLITLYSCHFKHKYTITVTRFDTNESGQKVYSDRSEIIMEQNDSLAYVNGAMTFLAHRLSDVLSGIDSNISKPVNYQVLNENGQNITDVIDNSMFLRIDTVYASRFQKRIKETQERRIELMKDKK